MRSLSDGERAILQQDGPEEDAGPRFAELRRLTARKSHPCDLCHAGWIGPGEPYDRLVTIDDEGFQIRRHCLSGGNACIRAALAAMASKQAERESFGPDDLPF